VFFEARQWFFWQSTVVLLAVGSVFLKLDWLSFLTLGWLSVVDARLALFFEARLAVCC
jgi:hypothetical protein